MRPVRRSEEAGVEVSSLIELLGEDLTPWQRRIVESFFAPENEDKVLRWVHTRKGGCFMWVPKEPASAA